MRKHKQVFLKLLVILSLGVLVFTMAACSSPADKAPVQDGATAPAAGEKSPAEPVLPRGGTMSIRLAGDWETLDPHTARTNFGFQLAFYLYDRLVALDGEGNVIPSMAESWEATEDSVTFKLKDGITCSLGEPITASVVAASLERLGAPETAAPYASRTFGVSGYTVTADDAAGKVTVRTNEPFSDLLIGLAMPWASIISSQGLAATEKLGNEAFGSGPFVLENAVSGSMCTLLARDGYSWGPNNFTTSEPGFPEKLVLQIVESHTTAANMLITGELDISSVDGPDLSRVEQEQGFAQKSGTSFGANSMLFNQAEGRPAYDKEVRRALAMAVDRASYNQAAHFGRAIVASSIISPIVEGYEPSTEDVITRFNPEEAKRILDEAGWLVAADGKRYKNNQPLNLRIVGLELQNAGPEFLLESFNKIGVSATVSVLDFPSLGEVLFGSGEWDVVVFPSEPPMPSLSSVANFFSGAIPPGGSNIGHIKNEIFNSAVSTALATPPGTRNVYWEQAQLALLEEVNLKPLTHSVVPYFGKNNISFELFSAYIIDPFSIRRIGE